MNGAPDPAALLADLALDLRWTWSHEADRLWQRIDADAWRQSHNPWTLLQDRSPERLRALAEEPGFAGELQRLAAARAAYLTTPGWFPATYGTDALAGVAYFSMEFGLGTALPLYAGGLGVLAGDYLKTASDFGLPAIGIGLLYQEGYFRQTIDAGGRQREAYPYNEPGSLPIRPAVTATGERLRIRLDLPGRALTLRVWRAQVGRVALYLLDTNDAGNSPTDRAITERLYNADPEARLLQEIVLGIAGWRVVEAVAPTTEVCHINEGHAAFAVFERARQAMRRSRLSFREALWATRAGNIFTTHTPVAAGFDRFAPALVDTYIGRDLIAETGLSRAELLGFGRANPHDDSEPFNMAYLAMRGAAVTIGVSRQHEQVSRAIFQPLFPRWPQAEVPVGHVTNGVHVPTWDSADADRLWTAACGKERWRCAPASMAAQLAALSDEELWAMRGKGRQGLVTYARAQLARQLAARGYPAEIVAGAAQALDPNILTLGFARRFTGYKRPNLLLHDPDRLRRLLLDRLHPAQIILAGKAHPADAEGKQMIREWIMFAEAEPELRRHIVFLEDYDLTTAQELVQGVDLWTNLPRRQWEACGTSGMKVLVNGGLNLSVLEGWWAEAYDPAIGWAIGDSAVADEATADARDAAELYDLLERVIVPEFYARDELGLPRRWLERIRHSLATATPAYSAGRMLLDYIAQLYLPGAGEFRRRAADPHVPAALAAWEERLRRGWPQLHIGEARATAVDGAWRFAVPVYLGAIASQDVRVDLYADAAPGEPPAVVPMLPVAAIPGAANGHIYEANAAADRPANDYTVRIVPARDGVRVPAELNLVLWQK